MKTRAISFRVREELFNYIKKKSKKKKISISKMMIIIICKYYKIKYIPEKIIIPKG